MFDASFVAIGKARVASAQSFELWQQATTEFTRRDHSIIACSRHVYIGVVLRVYSVRGKPRSQRNASGEVATLSFQSGVGKQAVKASVTLSALVLYKNFQGE